MKEFIEFRHLERLASESPIEFLKALETQLDIGGVNPAVELLRLSGICVDIYGTGKYDQLFKDSIELIAARAGEPKDVVEKLLQDVELFNESFAGFRDFRANGGVGAVLLERQVPAFLLAEEMFLGVLKEYAGKQTVEEMKKKYPFIIGFSEDGDVLAPIEKVSSQISQLFDMVMEQAGMILKYLVFSKAPLTGFNLVVSLEEIYTSRDHIYLFDRYDAIYKSYEHWRFWGGGLSRTTDMEIDFLVSDEDDSYFQRLSTFRARIRRNKWIYDFVLRAGKLQVDPSTNRLPTEGIRTPEEALAAIFCTDYFSSADLSEQILGVSLAEWVRAYIILKQTSATFIAQRTSMQTFSLSEWCISKTEEEWVNIFNDNGIDQNKARVIIENLTFNQSAKDLIDCPFIPLDGCLLILPSIVENISPAEAIFSNFMYKRLDVEFRGSGFETQIRNTLSSKNILGKNINSHRDGAEYECDVVFALGDSLFFVECKTFLQPHSPRTFYELIGKITDATVQLNRIADFYEANIEIVTAQLGLAETWRPKQIYKLVVSKALLGKPLSINGCYVTDDSILIRFFERIAPGMVIGRAIIPVPNPDYDGEINTEKLMRVISDPPPIKLAKARTSKKRQKIEMTKVSFSFYNLVALESSYVGRKKLRKLAKSLGVSPAYLKKKIQGK